MSLCIEHALPNLENNDTFFSNNFNFNQITLKPTKLQLDKEAIVHIFKRKGLK